VEYQDITSVSQMILSDIKGGLPEFVVKEINIFISFLQKTLHLHSTGKRKRRLKHALC